MYKIKYIKMKKLIVYLMFLMPLTIVSGQNYETVKGGIGLLAGVNYQNLFGKDFFGDKLNGKGIIGFHAGVNVQIPIASEFFFQPGLLFSTKGSKIDDTDASSLINLSYIELPLNMVYKSNLGNGFIMLGFGPYAGYALKGKVTYDGLDGRIVSDVKFKNSIETGDPISQTYLKALDFGGNIFAGYEMSNGIFLQVNTQIGMVNISPNDNQNPNSEVSIKNIGFGLSLGYRL